MDLVIEFLLRLEFWHWLALGLALLLAELITGSTYLLWPAVAAWITGLMLLAIPVGWPIQLLVFAIAVILLTMFARPILKNRLLSGDEGAAAQLNDRARALVGTRGVAAGAIEGGSGRVRLGDTEWAARSAETIADGARVVVVEVDMATLIVRAAD